MNKVLYQLAEKNKLPLYQFLDKKTVDWIKINMPSEINCLNKSLKISEYLSESERLFRLVGKLEKYYINKKMAWGIHGIFHAMRVALYAIIINKKYNLGLNNELLVISGFFHDIGRPNDKETAGHGELAADWINNNKEKIEKNFNIFFIPSDFKMIIEAIGAHDQNVDKNKNKNPYIDILKTADALDRYRLPKIKWWINDKHLKIKPTNEIKSLAFNFIIKSEKNKFNSPSLKQAIKCFLQI